MKIPVKINQDTVHSIYREPLLFNYNLKRDNKILTSLTWTENNIIYISDLMTDDCSNFISFETFKTKYINTQGINFL